MRFVGDTIDLALQIGHIQCTGTELPPCSFLIERCDFSLWLDHIVDSVWRVSSRPSRIVSEQLRGRRTGWKVDFEARSSTTGVGGLIRHGLSVADRDG